MIAGSSEEEFMDGLGRDGRATAAVKILFLQDVVPDLVSAIRRT